MEILPHNWSRFEDYGVSFVPLFKQAGLDLKQSMYEPANGKDGKFTVYNYWDLGSDLNNLVHAALVLPDYPEFGVLDEVLETEVKNIVLPIGRALSELESVPQKPGPARYLRVESQLSTTSAAEFAAELKDALAEFNEQMGWELGEAFLPVTGRDETLVQLWRVPDEVQDWGDALGRAPWNHLIDIRGWRLMNSTKFDPRVHPDIAGTSRATEVGGRGLVIHERRQDQDQYFYVAESAWRQRMTSERFDLPTLKDAFNQLGAEPRRVLLDLDRLKDLEETPGTGRGSGNVSSTNEQEIVIHEKTNFFVVPKKDWRPLNTALSQANASVRVKRGDKVAVLPPNAIPVGAYCVLINLDGIFSGPPASSS